MSTYIFRINTLHSAAYDVQTRGILNGQVELYWPSTRCSAIINALYYFLVE